MLLLASIPVLHDVFAWKQVYANLDTNQCTPAHLHHTNGNTMTGLSRVLNMASKSWQSNLLLRLRPCAKAEA